VVDVVTEADAESMTAVRRIRPLIETKADVGDFAEATEEGLPAHLVELFQRSTKDKSDYLYEKSIVTGLLKRTSVLKIRMGPWFD